MTWPSKRRFVENQYLRFKNFINNFDFELFLFFSVIFLYFGIFFILFFVFVFFVNKQQKEEQAAMKAMQQKAAQGGPLLQGGIKKSGKK